MMEGRRIPMVAILDDDGAVRASTANLMRSAGYETLAFASGEDLLASPRLKEAAIIITDLQMPDMTGLQVQNSLRSRGCQVPVIFITAYPDERARRQALNGGAVGFFSKPFDGSALLACVEQALNARGEDSPA